MYFHASVLPHAHSHISEIIKKFENKPIVKIKSHTIVRKIQKRSYGTERVSALN